MEIWGYAAGIFGVLVVVAGFLIMLGRKDQKAEDRDSKIAKLEKDYVSLDAKVSSLEPELRPRVTDAEKSVWRTWRRLCGSWSLDLRKWTRTIAYKERRYPVCSRRWTLWSAPWLIRASNSR